MRRKLLAIGALTVAGLVMAVLFPPVVATEVYETSGPEPPAWRAWRDWLAPADLEWTWIGDRRLWHPPVVEVGRALVPQTLAVEGVVIAMAAALLAMWVVNADRYRQAIGAGGPPGIGARVGPTACLAGLVLLSLGVTLARIPTEDVFCGAGLDGQAVPRASFWIWDGSIRWRKVRPPPSASDQLYVYRRQVAWRFVAGELAAIGTLGLLAAWLGIVRPRRRWRAAAARSATCSASDASA